MTINLVKYKQFYTPEKYSQILVNNIPVKSPNKIIDLTMGEGALLLEALKIWNDATFFGNDIDIKCCEEFFKIVPQITSYNKDIFKDSSISFFLKRIGKVDICLGNPPFDLIKQTNDTKRLFTIFSLKKYCKSVHMPAEVIFILQCLRILKKDGVLSVILPDGFFVNNSLKEFRKFLISNYTILKVIELPSEIFEKTKAKTHILILQNSYTENDMIQLFTSNLNKVITINRKQAIERMDYGFYNTSYKNMKYKKLSSFDVEIFRGTPKFLLKNIKESWILHTTSFRKTNTFVSPLRTPNALSKYKDRIALSNDIIIPRVGTNILGKVGIVKSGFFIASDCIFIIRAIKERDRDLIYNTLNSEFGKKWIISISKGVGARHITLKDIGEMPILLNKEHT